MSDPSLDLPPMCTWPPAGHAGAGPPGGGESLEPECPARSATLSRALEYVCLNLSRADLNPAMIADAIGVSRAVLYREFAGSGGVSSHIQDVRIAGARAHLQAHAHRRSVVSEACDRFGYASVARFTRLFRQRHHETPAAFVERVRALTPRSR